MQGRFSKINIQYQEIVKTTRYWFFGMGEKRWPLTDTLQLPNYTSYWDTILGYLRKNAHQLFMTFCNKIISYAYQITVISSIPVRQVNMWYPFQISAPAIVAISNRYPTTILLLYFMQHSDHRNAQFYEHEFTEICASIGLCMERYETNIFISNFYNCSRGKSLIW